MICSSCGLDIIGKTHGPYEKNRFVCDNCWNNPILFFPDKMSLTLENIANRKLNDIKNDLNIIEIIDIFKNFNNVESYKSILNQELNIKVNVIKINQKDMPLYIGKLKASEVLLLSAFDHWNNVTLEGFQREKFREKTIEIKKYIESCPISIIPTVLASLRESTFKSTNNDFGLLEIPLKPGAISILDGQQRIGGFEEIYIELKKAQVKQSMANREEIIKKYSELLSFEIPIVFIDSKSICENINKKAQYKTCIKPLDLDGAFFFIINKTQKSVNPSLKDELLYKTVNSGITGIPIIEKELWRTEIVPIVNELNKDISPLCGLINLGGLTSKGHLVPLFSFVSSLKPLFSNSNFKELDTESKKQFVINYWSCIREMFPESFDEKTRNEYLILKTTSIYALNYLSNDVFSWCLSSGLDPYSDESIYKFISSLNTFDWKNKTSPFAFLGGGKGVRKAYNILLILLSEKSVNNSQEMFQKNDV